MRTDLWLLYLRWFFKQVIMWLNCRFQDATFLFASLLMHNIKFSGIGIVQDLTEMDWLNVIRLSSIVFVRHYSRNIQTTWKIIFLLLTNLLLYITYLTVTYIKENKSYLFLLANDVIFYIIAQHELLGITPPCLLERILGSVVFKTI